MATQKILMAWMGFKGDFFPPKDSNEIIPNPDGPNISMHRYFPKTHYDRHVILYTTDTGSQMKMQCLEKYFKKNARHKVEFRKVYMDEKDLLNLQTLQAKLQAVLMDHRHDQVDILVTPGTKAMHTAWHLEHLHHQVHTRLIQIRPKEYNGGEVPELLKIDLDSTELPYSALAREQALDHPAPPLPQFISQALKPVYELADKLSKTDKIPALIVGEGGTGKEQLARYIHLHSPRKDKPFMTVNCAALSEEALRCKLFGHEKNAFIGASRSRHGLLEDCEGGTLFLDEIGDISPAMQQALLRVLQEGEMLALGSKESKKVDVRILSATHKHLPTACNEGKFRWDLYYRLAVIEFELPTLAQWTRSDREQLLALLIQQQQTALRKKMPLQLPREIKSLILDYHFPGNVREMENLVARLYVVAAGKVTLQDLPPTLVEPPAGHPLSLAEVEKRHVDAILRAQGFHYAETARILDCSIGTLKRKIKEYGLVQMTQHQD